MKDLEVERILRQYAEDLVSRHTWLTIRFEYSEKRSVYLVSYSPKCLISGNDTLINEMMDFEDRMNDVYGDDAPLFCEDERLFKLVRVDYVWRLSYRDHPHTPNSGVRFKVQFSF